MHFLPTDPNEQTNLLLGSLNASAQAAYDALSAELDAAISPANVLGTPVETAWQTTTGSEYARIYRTQARALNGISDTTWAPEPTVGVRNGTQALRLRRHR